LTPVPPTGAAPPGTIAYFQPPTENVPQWAKVLTDTFPTLVQAVNASTRFIIFLPVHNRTFALCFGYGRAALEWSAIEGNFGLRFAARRMDSGNMTEYKAKVIGGSNRSVAVQVPVGVGLHEFGVEPEAEFTRQLAGVLDAQGREFAELGVIVASNSVGFTAETDLFKIQATLSGMLEEVATLEAKEDLAFVDSLEPLPANSEIAKQLDRLLAEHLFDDMRGAVVDPSIAEDVHSLTQYLLEISPPDDLSVSSVDMLYVQRGDSVAALEDLSVESLRNAIAALGGRLGVGSLAAIRLVAASQDDSENTDAQQLKNWLVFEAGNADKRYVLSFGKWFSLNENYTRKLNDDLTKLENVTALLGLPLWQAGEHEGPYNERAQKASTTHVIRAVLLDQVDVRPEDGDEVEACDLFYESGHLVHVKRGNEGSRVLSHLFAQGVTSAQLLLGDTVYKKNFLEAVDGAGASPAIQAAASEAPQIVTYAIGMTGGRRVPEDLPTFSKVNLRDSTNRLKRNGFRPTVCRIQLG
jgi:uncharacterized protein (TIGR04141 family)